MPLTTFQMRLGRLLATNRTEDSYLAGGAAILAAPNSLRFSHDLGYFHDSAARVASAFEADTTSLRADGNSVDIEISQPGYIRAIVTGHGGTTKIEWAQDSTWRFMPVVRSAVFGFELHPIDLATNKVLALAGRDEPRDLLDTLFLHANVLALGALAWAAVGKDPGYSPGSLLAMLRRRGRLRPEDLKRLDLLAPMDVAELKVAWSSALEEAEAFVSERPIEEVGCLYYSPSAQRFVCPGPGAPADTLPHYGRPGGVLPAILP